MQHRISIYFDLCGVNSLGFQLLLFREIKKTSVAPPPWRRSHWSRCVFLMTFPLFQEDQRRLHHHNNNRTSRNEWLLLQLQLPHGCRLFSSHWSQSQSQYHPRTTVLTRPLPGQEELSGIFIHTVTIAGWYTSSHCVSTHSRLKKCVQCVQKIWWQ